MFQPHERTFRISIVEGADYGSVSIGNGVSGMLFKTIGYFGVFGCSSGCCLVALLYCTIFMKESLILPAANKDKSDIVTKEHVYQVKNLEDKKTETPPEDKGCGTIVRKSVLYILEGIRTVVTPREGWRRALVLLGVFQYICYICGYTGTEGSQRQYFLENKYKWTEEEISTYLFNFRIASWLGLWLVVPFLTNVVNLSDSIIAVIAVVTASTGKICIELFPSIQMIPALQATFCPCSRTLRSGRGREVLSSTGSALAASWGS